LMFAAIQNHFFRSPAFSPQREPIFSDFHPPGQEVMPLGDQNGCSGFCLFNRFKEFSHGTHPENLVLRSGQWRCFR
jgi:hypothetical protein